MNSSNFNTSNIFNSNYSTSNPFNMGNNNSYLNQMSLNDAYNKLEMLKAQQSQLQQSNQQQTVFSDIANEFKDLSKDESAFIVNSNNYQKAYAKYQEEFSEFLTSKFSSEFLQVNGGRSLEELLFTIKQEKENYKNKFTEDINQIRDQNKTLIESNNKLVQDNIELQEQLKHIQNTLLKE